MAGIPLIDYLPNSQTINAEYYSSLLVQLKDIIVGKMLREGHQGGLVLARQCPGSPGTCNPEESSLPGLPVSWSPTLFSGSGPIGLPPVPWTEKNKLKSRHFSSDAEVTAAAETWLDGQTSEFFSVACRSQSNWLRSVLSFVGSMLNKSRVWSL